MKDIRFGVITPQYVSWDRMVARWQHVEQLGFDSVWVADHWVNFMEPHRPWFEAWTLLTGMAMHTARIRIGPLISPIPFHNPAFLARQALTVDHISGGRLEIGLGAGLRGDRDPSYSMAGAEDWPNRERVARLREAVEIIDMLLRNEESSFEGRYYRVQGALMAPRPIQRPRPPITIAASGIETRKVAAQWADTWNTVSRLYPPPLNPSNDSVRRTDRWMNYASSIGREPSTLRRSVLHFHPQPGMEFCIESAEMFREIMESVIEIGFNEIILQYPYYDEELPLFDTVVGEVLPLLRA